MSTIKMIAEQILKDVIEVHSRLFDHRPILQGHMKAFVKEFEEKRGNRELERLQKTSNVVKDMKDVYVEETSQALDTYLANVHAKLKVAVEVCAKIEEKENNVDVGFLQLQRQQRRQDWDTFMQSQFEKSAEVDRWMDEEMKRVTEEYNELEAKMNQTPVSSLTP